MPKSQKRKKADFQKVKLKVGRKLSKVANETDLTFRSKKIKIVQNLTDISFSPDGPKTKLKLTLGELIKRCDPNKSVSQRQSALDGFRELILSSDAGKQLVLSSGYLMAVMTKSCSLLADAEMCVRRSVLRLCRLILSILELKEPIFLRTLCARLCCDLNHFSDSIRLDALKLFDMLLDKYPRFVTGKFCNLVPCAIEAALGPLSMECGGGRQANTLLFKPNSRTFCREWRIQMLSRLTAIVDVAIDLHFEEQNAEKFVEHQDWPYPYVSWKVRRHFSFAWQLDDTKGIMRNKEQQYSQLHCNTASLHRLLSRIMPFIKECVIAEYMSDNHPTMSNISGETDGQLMEESLPVLQAVVGLMHSFGRCLHCLDSDIHRHSDAEISLFCVQFLKELTDLFYQRFPLSFTKRLLKERKKCKKVAVLSVSQFELSVCIGEVYAVILDFISMDKVAAVQRLNMQICDTFAVLPMSRLKALQIDKDMLNRILLFLLQNIKKCLHSKQTINQTVSLLRNVFFHFRPNKRQDKLLNRVQLCFINASLQSTEKKLLLDLFLDIGLSLDSDSSYRGHLVCNMPRHNLLQPFFDYLFVLLEQLADAKERDDLLRKLLNALHMPYTSPLLQLALQQNMERFLDLDSGLFCRLSQEYHYSCVLIVKRAYRCTPAPKNILDMVVKLVYHPGINDDTANGLVMGLRTEFSQLDEEMMTSGVKEAYLRFFFSFLVGHLPQKEKFGKYQEEHSMHKGKLTHVFFQSSKEEMKRHEAVSKCVWFGFISCSDEKPLYDRELILNMWNNNIIGQYHCLSDLTVYGALMNWYCAVICFRQDIVNHMDIPQYASSCRANEDMYDFGVVNFLPIIKAHLRVYTRLAFSVAYNIVSYDKVLQNDNTMYVYTAGILWKVVMSIIEKSLQFFEDICHVMIQFLEDFKDENETHKIIRIFATMMVSEEMASLHSKHKQKLEYIITNFVSTIQIFSPLIQETSWWKEFTSSL